MGAITGAQAKSGAKITSTWGTAASLSTGDQLDGVTIQTNENAQELTVPPIGSGKLMKSTNERGNVAPSISVDGALGYNTPQIAMLAQLFQGASVNSQGSGAYCHSILFNASTPSKFVTVAFQAHSATTGSMEIPSAAVTKATITAENPASYFNASFEMLGSEHKISGQTNTYLTLNNLTATDSKRVVFEFSDEFLINAQAGAALASPTDRLNITGATLELERPQEFALEAKGSAGNSAPVATGDYPFIARLTVNLRTLEDWTYITAHQGATEYKASLTKLGSLIGGSQYYTFQYNLPRLKIVSSPDLGLQEAGNNGYSVVFEGLVATAAPTGMLDSYPYFRIINTKSTSYLA